MNNVNLWLSLLGLVLPLLVGYATTLHASPTVKGWVLAILSGVSAVVAEIARAGDNLQWSRIGANLLLIFASSVVAYKGGIVKKPAQQIQLSTPNTGVGPKT